MAVTTFADASILTSDFATTTANSDVVDLTTARTACLVAAVTVAASTADTFVDGDVSTGDDTITLTAHGWQTGRKVAATTSGVLPGGLSATDYYVIRVDADTIKLASSYANSQAGTAVDITSAAGGGTHTLTPAALASSTVVLQGSVDNSTFINVASGSNNITATANFMYDITAFSYRYARLQFALSAGQLSVVCKSFIK